MATLQAIVDIQDRASAKFARMTAAAKAFEEQLDRVDRKVKEVEAKMAALSKMNISIRAALDTSAFDAQLAAMLARSKLAGMTDINIGSGVSSVVGGLGGFAMAADDMPVPQGNLPQITGDGEEMSPVEALKRDRSKKRSINLAQADNGPLGFGLTLVRALLNIRQIMRPMTELFRRFGVYAVTALEGTLKFFKVSETLFGKRLIGGLLRVVPLLATLASGVVALSVASGVFVSVGTAVAAVIGLIAAAITTLVAPLAALTTAIGAVVGVIGFVALPMMKWIGETKDLIEQKDELNKKLETLDKGTKDYIQTQKELDEVNKKLNKNGGEGIYRQMQASNERLKASVFSDANKQNFVDILANALDALRPMIPIIGKLVNVFSGEIKKVSEGLAEWTKDPKNLALVLNFFEMGAKLIQPLASGLGAIGRIFMAIGVAVGPIAEVMFKDLAGWLDGIAKNLSSPEGLKSMRKFFADAYPVFKKIAILVKDFIVGLVKLGARLMPYLEPVIDFIGEFGEKLVAWVIETVEKYGPTLADLLGKIGKLIAMAWDWFTKIFDALEPVFRVLLRIVGVVIDASTAFLGLLDSSGFIDGLRIAFELLVKPIELVLSLIEKIIELIGKIPSPFKNMSPDQVAAYRNGVMGGGENLPGGNASNAMTGGGGIPRSPNVEGGGASGAIVTRPTRALIGEAGPEAVVPLHATRGSRRLQLGSSGGGVQISGDVHVHGVQNLDDFVNEVQKYVSNLPRESGSGMSVG